MRLVVLRKVYDIARLHPDAGVPLGSNGEDFTSVTRTDDELSVVAPQGVLPTDVIADRGWRCLKVEGPLDLALTGVLLEILGPLADAGISVFPIATYDTDYVLVKEETLDHAVQVLRAHGHEIS